MKNYVGRKIRGFRFEDVIHGVAYSAKMEKHIGEIGEIKYQNSYQVRIQFEDDWWEYPISLIEPHLIEEESPEIIDLSNVEGVEMMVSKDGKYFFKEKVIAKLGDAYIDNKGYLWYYAEPIPQLPQYTHAELVEKLGHEFEYGGKDE